MVNPYCVHSFGGRVTEPRFAVVAEGLRKRYGGTEALAGLDLRVPAGTVHGLLAGHGDG
ncbi:hypothetical protein GCM10023178_75010 [Actinomadura luteofluorescens]